MIEVEPELAGLTILVEAQATDRHTAMELLGRRAGEVSDAVARFDAAVERAETSRLHVYPELDRKKSEKVRRYVGRVTTSLTVHDFSVLSDLIEAVSAVELASVDGPWWQLRVDSSVYRDARIAAAADALTRARDYAAAYGAQVVGLIEIADQGMSHQPPVPMASPQLAYRAGGGGAEYGGDAFDMGPARQQVSGSVEARFLITQPDLASVVVPARGPA